MDRNRVIVLVEGEIMRNEALAKIADKQFAKSYLDVAEALTDALNAYRREARN